MPTTVLLYTHPGDTSAAAPTAASGTAFTMPTGRSQIDEIALVNGSTPIVADDVGFAQIEINLVQQNGSVFFATLTSAGGGIGDVPANGSVLLSDAQGGNPWAMSAGETLTVDIAKPQGNGDPGGPGVKLGAFSLLITYS